MLKKYFLILLIFTSLASANVTMNSPSSFHVGEPLIFSLEAIGGDIKLPVIKSIDGFIVTQNGSSKSLSIVNGKRKQNIQISYKLYPNKTITIQKFKVLIDGKEYFTKEKIVSQIKVQKTKSKYIDFVIGVSQKDLFVGEQTIFTLTFKYRRDLQIVDLGFAAPSFSNFWYKQISQPAKYDEGQFVVQKLNYIIFPQKSGKITIPALKVDVSLVDSRNNNMSFFGPAVRIEKIYSNELVLNIKDLPNDIFLIGDFKVKENLENKELKAGDALNFDIEIQGRGNIDDIPELKLDIPNATIYDNKAIKTYDMIDGLYGGTYKKSYSIVANEDFIIPSAVLKYFDKNNNIIKVLKTKEYKIKIKKDTQKSTQKEIQLHKQQKNENEINKKNEKEIVKVIETTDNQKLLYFFFGFIVSTVVFSLALYIKNQRSKKLHAELPLEKEVKQTKSTNELLNILLSYINIDEDLDKMIYSLENEKTVNFKQIKKDILEIIKQKEIKD